MSKKGRTAMEGGMKVADGCDEERCQWKLVVAAPAGSDGGSFSLKECRGAFCGGAAHARGGWRPHLQRLSHWRQSGKWGRRRGRGTKTG